MLTEHLPRTNRAMFKSISKKRKKRRATATLKREICEQFNAIVIEMNKTERRTLKEKKAVKK